MVWRSGMRCDSKRRGLHRSILWLVSGYFIFDFYTDHQNTMSERMQYKKQNCQRPCYTKKKGVSAFVLYSPLRSVQYLRMIVNKIINEGIALTKVSYHDNMHMLARQVRK